MVNFKAVHHYSKDLNVLYIENDEKVRKSTAYIFREYFLTLDIAKDGLDGLEKYREYYANNRHYYDLVISDIVMPRFNGIELSDAILEINDDQMILILSAYSEPEYLYELINLGISSFLGKPIKINLLNRILHRISRIVLNRKAELKHQEHEKEEKNFLQSVMDIQENIIVISDGENIESANQSLLDFFDFKTVEDYKQVHVCISFTFIRSKGYFHLELLAEDMLWTEHMLSHKDQDFMVIMQNIKTLKEESFKVSVNYFHSKKRYIATFTNITKMALDHKIDQHKANYDNLTEIYNRHSFYDILQKYFTSASKISHMTLLMLDIDHFKVVNDKYGHLTGDAVLKEIALIIKKNIRKNDIFARWGGEEFVIIFEDCTLEKSLKVAEHLRQTIAETVFEKVGHITCSFGISIYQEGDTVTEMISRADEAMYAAKKGGRNQICYV